MLVLVLYGALIVVIAGISMVSPMFRSTANLWTVARQASIPGIIAIAQTMIILSGGIDLSVSSLVTGISLICAGFMDSKDERFIPVLLLMLAIGLAVGLFNGLLVTKGRVPPFITTLGTPFFYRVRLSLTPRSPREEFLRPCPTFSTTDRGGRCPIL